MKRIKFKNKLQTIVSIFLIVSILCATAAIFVGTRVDDTETNHITDVGYILGTSRGTGSLVSSANCITFAETDLDILHYRGDYSYINYLNQENALQICHASSWKTDEGIGYVVIESVENGDSYLKLHRGLSTNGFQVYFEADRLDSNASRGNTVIVEFDLKIDDGFEFDFSNTSDPLLLEMSFFGVSEMLSSNEGKPTRYSYGGLYMSDVEGYYTYAKSIAGASSLDNYLMKYGEWYNFRLEFKYDRDSTKYTQKTYVNNILVNHITAEYFKDNAQSNAFAFGLLPRMYAYNLDISIDNYSVKN